MQRDHPKEEARKRPTTWGTLQVEASYARKETIQKGKKARDLQLKAPCNLMHPMHGKRQHKAKKNFVEVQLQVKASYAFSPSSDWSSQVVLAHRCRWSIHVIIKMFFEHLKEPYN